jgi:3-phosphoshikimate 1-carboxyvinyltransferase
MTLKTSPTGRFAGTLRPPSDKSLTHRAYLFASIALTESCVRMPLRGEDCESTLRCLNQLGLRHEWHGDHTVRLIPARDWQTPTHALDCGNSGTTMRLLAGLLASRPISATLVGDESLSRRPMKRVAEPLRLMGAQLQGDTPPLYVKGGNLRGISYSTPVASAQVKSSVLLAGLRAEGETRVTEPALSRDHTERMLTALGVALRREGLTVSVSGGAQVEGFAFTVPGDISSAAFPMVAAAMIAGGHVTVSELGLNPSRTGLLDVLQQVGAEVSISESGEELGEPIASVSVRSLELQPFHISGDLVPRLIDEIPVLAVLATQCAGTSVIRDAAELRVKESDRIESVAAGLRAMGADVETFPDGLAANGPCRLRGAAIDSRGDHRLGMAFAVAGLIAEGETVIANSDAILTSYPSFEADLARLCHE